MEIQQQDLFANISQEWKDVLCNDRLSAILQYLNDNIISGNFISTKEYIQRTFSERPNFKNLLLKSILYIETKKYKGSYGFGSYNFDNYDYTLKNNYFDLITDLTMRIIFSFSVSSARSCAVKMSSFASSI